MTIPEAPKAADIISKAKHITVFAALIGVGFTSGVVIGGIKEIFKGFDDRASVIESQMQSHSKRLNSHAVDIRVNSEMIEIYHGP